MVICVDSGARCSLFAYGTDDATATPKPHHLVPHLNLDWFYLSGTALPRMSWKLDVVIVVVHSIDYLHQSTLTRLHSDIQTTNAQLHQKNPGLF